MSESAASKLPEPREPHDVSVPLPSHPVNYYLIFGILVVLMACSVGISTHRFAREFVNVLVAMLIASIQGTCVALFFMHLKFEGKLIYLTLVVPIILAILLVVALLPDITFMPAFNDVVGMFERTMHGR